ncbi:MAG: hypothetical protein II938_00920 [Alphaproteobacteria bacterium]|nr:hypothetical protein [Alphaproteobacteria bacterium]
MKNNYVILAITFSFLLLSGLMTCSITRVHNLRTRFFKEHLLSEKLAYTDTGLTLNGRSLVLYNVTHKEYPTFTIQRLQATNDDTQFQLNLQNIHGKLIAFFQKTDPYSFKRDIVNFSPQKEALHSPLVMLAALGYDDINCDVQISAKQIASNQLQFDLIFKELGQTKARFTTTIPTEQSSLSIWEKLKGKEIPLKITYLASDIKDKLDNYTHSKGLPPISQGQQILLPFFK